MGLGFQGLFPPRGDFIKSYDCIDSVTGQGYIRFYGGTLAPKSSKYEFNLQADDSTQSGVTSISWIAQTFTIGTTGTDEAFYPTKIRVLVNVAGTNEARIEIQETTAGEPNGTVKLRINNAGIPRAAAGDNWLEFDLTNLIEYDGLKLEAGTQYAIVFIRYTGSTSTSLRYANTGTYTGGAMWTTPDSGANWTESTGDDLIFEVWGSTENPYILSTKALTANWTSTTIEKAAISIDVDALTATLSFEGNIGSPSIMEGTAILNATITSSADGYLPFAEVFKVRGTTETSIGSCIGWIDNSAFQAQIEITKTQFQIGDKIKLKLSMGIKEATASQADATFSHNPATPNLTLDLPFKLDL